MKTRTLRQILVVFASTVVMLAMILGILASPVLSAAAGIATSGNSKFEAEYDSLEDALEAGSELNIEIASEGFVLMKNENNALPLSKTERKVTVLGTAANSLIIGGSGSGSQSAPGASSGITEYAQASTLYDSLEAAGIEANPRVRDRYESVPSLEAYAKLPREGGHYMQLAVDGKYEFDGNTYSAITNGSLSGADTNYSVYGDAAIVVISRGGREGDDNLTSGVGGHSDSTEHYLELDDAEKELMAYAKANFDKVVVIINSPSAMELGCLENDDGISAILWIGLPGWNGIMAVGGILTGTINPSGRLVDIYPADFTKDPTWYNNGTSGSYTLRVDEINSEYSNYTTGTVDYAEGIYYGYRYYETVAADLGEDGEEWYDEAVVYPFGYGLSYTNFKQSIVGVEGDLSNADGSVTVSVKVTNAGNVAGKDVVELYSTAPYTAGGIEKAEVNLVGFAKTDSINPGSSQTVKVTFDVKDLASFDYNDANDNSNYGYELEKGSYVLSVRSDSHTVLDSYTMIANNLLTWDEDGDSSTPNNIFSQPIDSAWGAYNTNSYAWTVSGIDHYLTRDQLIDEGEAADLSFLAWLGTSDNVFVDAAFEILAGLKATAPSDEATDLWYVNNVPSGWTQGTGVVQADTGRYPIELYDLLGVDYDDAEWDALLNQLTWDELVSIAGTAGYYLSADAETIGYEAVENADSSVQLSDGWAWACASVIASTWNVDLAYAQGNLVGNESMLNGNLGWFGPGMDIRRNPLAGRGFEYYSQDGVQGGLIAASVVKGATDMGCRVFVKHSFLNDQETSRTGGVHFATEQAIREIYAKTFEYAVKKGNANGIMTAFNLIGLSSSANYATCVQLYRNEWGFDGMIITDRWESGKAGSLGWDGDALARASVSPLNADTKNNSAISTYAGTWDATNNAVLVNGVASATQWYWVRETAHRALYTVVNSNAMLNGYAAYMFPDATVTLTAGEKADDRIVLAAADEVFGATGYTLTATGLPEGLSLSEGKIVGTPSASDIGKQVKVEVTLTGKYGMSYITDKAEITVKIEAPSADTSDVYISGLNTLTYNSEVTGNPTVTLRAVTLTEDVNYFPNVNPKNLNSVALINQYLNSYTSVTYSATGLPEGLVIDATTGVISGTPKVSGTYYAEIRATLVQITGADQKPFGTEAKTSNVVYSAYAAITIEGGYNVVFDANYAGGGQQVIGFAEGATATDFAAVVETPVHSDGYTFLGWATTADATVANVDINTLSLTDGATYYAVWQMPSIALIDGIWWVNGVNTGISAEGQTGAAGAAGVDGVDGLNGVGIVSIEKVNSDGLVDTYVITLTNGETVEFEITNGANGKDGTNGTNGTNGANGATGATGAPGADGKDGSGSGAAIALSVVALVLALAAGVVCVLFVKKKN